MHRLGVQDTDRVTNVCGKERFVKSEKLVKKRNVYWFSTVLPPNVKFPLPTNLIKVVNWYVASSDSLPAPAMDLTVFENVCG